MKRGGPDGGGGPDRGGGRDPVHLPVHLLQPHDGGRGGRVRLCTLRRIHEGEAQTGGRGGGGGGRGSLMRKMITNYNSALFMS